MISLYLYVVKLSNQNRHMECYKQSGNSYNQKQNSIKNMNESPRKTSDALKTYRKNESRNREILNPWHLQNTIIREEEEYSIPSVLPQKHIKCYPNNPQNLPTIYRKHEYDGKQFTQIYNMKTATSQIRTKTKIQYTLAEFNEIATYGSFLINISEVSSQNTYKKTQWRQFLNSDQNCNCSNNQCQLNYCICLKQGRSCDISCLCSDCSNYQEKQSIQAQTYMRTYKKQGNINQMPEQIHQKRERNTSITVVDTVKNENFNKCHCRKSGGCLLKYCGCRRLGINCSFECLCIECKN